MTVSPSWVSSELPVPTNSARAVILPLRGRIRSSATMRAEGPRDPSLGRSDGRTPEAQAQVSAPRVPRAAHPAPEGGASAHPPPHGLKVRAILAWVGATGIRPERRPRLAPPESRARPHPPAGTPTAHPARPLHPSPGAPFAAAPDNRAKRPLPEPSSDRCQAPNLWIISHAPHSTSLRSARYIACWVPATCYH